MSFVKKILQFTLSHKIASGIIALVVLGGGYYGYQKIYGNTSATRYVTAAAEKGTLIVSITGSGQTSASNQVDIKSKVSGDIVYVGVKNGQEVKAGTLIAQLDAREAQRSVRDAELSLESAILSLDKLKLNQQRQLNNPDKSYEEGMDTLASFYDELPIILDNLKDIYFQTDLSSGESFNCSIDYFSLNDCNITYYADYGENKKKFTAVPNQISKLYREVNDLYSKSKSDYHNVQRNGDNEERLSAIEQGREIAIKTAEMIKIGRDVVSSFQDIHLESGGTFTKQEIVDGHISDLKSYSNTITTYANNLLSAINSINGYVSSIENQPLDLRAQELTVKQREGTLFTAQQNLDDHYIRAPFAGVIAKVNVKKGDSVSAGTAVATLVTRQKIAEVSLNEIDVAQIKAGQKVTLTFDAVPDLTITGQVAEVDAVGTVSQGVVTYGVKIGFDTQDDRVKPGMSVSAAIITDVKQNVVLVPNSAVKSNGNSQYVEILVNGAPQSKNVETGLSNDTMTEIVSGLKEGDQVVTQTITANTTVANQSQQNTGIRIPGITGGGGGFRGGGLGH